MNDRLAPRVVPFELGSTLPYLLNRAGVHIGLAFTQEIERYDVSLPLWRVLAALSQANDQTLTGLAMQTSIELSTVSRIVAAAHRRGLVARRRSGTDARAIVIRLTAAGRELAARIIPLAELYERIALAGIESGEVATLKRLLGRVYENIASLGAAKKAPRSRARPRRNRAPSRVRQ